MKNYDRRVLPPKETWMTGVTVWDGPESLQAVLRLKGKGKLLLVHPNDADGKPVPGSKRDCLRIVRPDRVFVAHPGDIVTTDKEGRYGSMHGLEWASAHGARFTREDID